MEADQRFKLQIPLFDQHTVWISSLILTYCANAIQLYTIKITPTCSLRKQQIVVQIS